MSTSRVYTVGQVLTAAQMNDLPQGVLGKTTGTANVGPTSAGTELDIITAPAVTVAGTNRRLRITFHAPGVAATVTNETYDLRIKEGATILSKALYVSPSEGGNAPNIDFVAFIDSPSAASHTYKATIIRITGTGTATVQGATDAPIHITVEDVGVV